MRYLFGFLCVCALGAVPLVGCSDAKSAGGNGGGGDAQPSESSGSLQLNLELAGGAQIDEVSYAISGNDLVTPINGTIDTSAPGATASVEVFGIPPGDDYLIEMMATSVDGGTTCEGSTMFDIDVGQVTSVMVMLKCKPPERYGAVRANGKLNVCAELTKAIVSPLETSVGSDIDVSAQAFDAEDDPISYRWSPGDSFANPMAAVTTYTCEQSGAQTITIEISDDDFQDCVDEWNVEIECVERGGPRHFDIVEATIRDMQEAMEKRWVTSRELVEMYLARIEAYDQQGPAVNAMITINPQVMATAEALDAERLLTGPRSPLHGIPVVLKDNFDTADLPTTAGSVSLQGSIPPDDAFLTERFREAGALILGKTNLHEFAAGYATVSSLGGQTLNPYDTTRIPGGSSGGTGAAIAANFAAIGMGTDTVGSIRVPASFDNLVGLKPTLGLTSRDGIIPLTLTRDVAGPITRSVEDAAIVLDIIAAFDPADPVTAASAGQIPASYTDFLDADGLDGARIGVLRSRIGTHPDVGALTNAAIADMTAAGAQMVDPVAVPWPGVGATYYNSFEYDMNNYLESLGAGAPFPSLQALIASGQYMSSLNGFPFGGLRGDIPPDQDPLYLSQAQTQATVQAEVMGVMNGQNLDAILYPSLMAPPPVVGDPLVGITSSVGQNANLAAFIGYPAISVPAGFTSGGLPVGVELLGKPFDEPTLIGLAYAYEQATKHRQPPAATPRLPGETP